MTTVRKGNGCGDKIIRRAIEAEGQHQSSLLLTRWRLGVCVRDLWEAMGSPTHGHNHEPLYSRAAEKLNAEFVKAHGTGYDLGYWRKWRQIAEAIPSKATVEELGRKGVTLYEVTLAVQRGGDVFGWTADVLSGCVAPNALTKALVKRRAARANGDEGDDEDRRRPERDPDQTGVFLAYADAADDAEAKLLNWASRWARSHAEEWRGIVQAMGRVRA